MLLALLILVAGRLGGADVRPLLLAVDTVRGIIGGVAEPASVGDEPVLGAGIETVR